MVATLSFLWNLQEDVISSTMEPSLVSKKKGMSRNMQLNDIQNNPKLVTKRVLAVLCASVVSTDGMLSVPLIRGKVIAV